VRLPELRIATDSDVRVFAVICRVQALYQHVDKLKGVTESSMMGNAMPMGTGMVKPEARANAHLFHPSHAVAAANDALLDQQVRASMTKAEVLTSLHRLTVETATPAGAPLIDKGGKPAVTQYHVQRLRTLLAQELNRMKERDAVAHATAKTDAEAGIVFLESWTPDRPTPPPPRGPVQSELLSVATATTEPPVCTIICPPTTTSSSSAAAVAPQPSAATTTTSSSSSSNPVTQAMESLLLKKNQKLAQSQALTGAEDPRIHAAQVELQQLAMQQFADDRVIHAQFADFERKANLSRLLELEEFGGGVCEPIGHVLPRSLATLAKPPSLIEPNVAELTRTDPVTLLPPKVKTMRKKLKLKEKEKARKKLEEQTNAATTLTEESTAIQVPITVPLVIVSKRKTVAPVRRLAAKDEEEEEEDPSIGEDMMTDEDVLPVIVPSIVTKKRKPPRTILPACQAPVIRKG